MTITYPLTLPTATGIRSLIVTPETLVGVTESSWDFSQKTQRFQGQRWILEATLPIMDYDDACEWEAFFLSLNGREGTFTAGDPRGATPRGVATGTILVKGAAQTGQSIEIDGCTPATTNIFKKGDYIQFGTGSTARLYRQLVNTDSDGSGNATLTLWPLVKAANSPADNAAVTVQNTVALFRMLDDNVPFNINTAMQSDYKFKAASVV